MLFPWSQHELQRFGWWVFFVFVCFYGCFFFFFFGLVWFDLVLSSSQALWLEQEQDLTLQGENSLLVLKLKQSGWEHPVRRGGGRKRSAALRKELLVCFLR